jgi:hypothetical protein
MNAVGNLWENGRSRQVRKHSTASNPLFRTYRKGAGVKPTRHLFSTTGNGPI